MKNAGLFVIAAVVSATVYAGTAFAADCSQPNIRCVPQEHATIQACANAAMAGDTCLIAPGGLYDERVTPPRSGTSGNPITFMAEAGTRPKVRGFDLSGKSYITISGLEITNSGMSSETYVNPSLLVTGTNHVKIMDNNIHDTSWIAIRSNSNGGGAKATNLTIRGNTIAYIGPVGGRAVEIQCWCDHTLIEDNDMSHGEDFVQIFGHNNVIRNNLFHDGVYYEAGGNQHLDGVQSYCTGTNPAPESANYILVEGNIHRDNPGPNDHFSLINGTDSCGGTTTWIDRFNSPSNLGSGSHYSDNNLQSMADHHKYYNNTTVRAGIAVYTHGTVTMNGSTYASVLNNIFVDAISSNPPASMYALKTGDATSRGDYNLAYQSTGPINWAVPIANEANGKLNQNPLFVSSTDFRLQESSPAVDAGGALTAVSAGDTGSGISLIVNDAHFFQDGWAGVNPDWIAVGNAQNTAQISTIDYTGNSITLVTPLQRASGDPVWLYKDSSGKRVLYGAAPDMGALEYESSAILYGDVSENGTISAYDASLIAQYAVGSITLTQQQVTKAEVSGNGTVSAYDASLIAQYAVGLITKFPVEG